MNLTNEEKDIKILEDIEDYLISVDTPFFKTYKGDRAILWQELFSHYSDEHMELMDRSVQLNNKLNNYLGYTDRVLRAFEREKANRAIESMLME